NQHVGARLGIAAVIVWTMTIDAHVLHDHVATEYRMNLPHRRVANSDAVDEDVLAAVGLDELRAQVMTIAEDTVIDWNAFFSHLEQRVAIGTRLVFPRPPVIVVALAVEYAVAGDGDVALTESVNER